MSQKQNKALHDNGAKRWKMWTLKTLLDVGICFGNLTMAQTFQLLAMIWSKSYLIKPIQKRTIPGSSGRWTSISSTIFYFNPLMVFLSPQSCFLVSKNIKSHHLALQNSGTMPLILTFTLSLKEIQDHTKPNQTKPSLKFHHMKITSYSLTTIFTSQNINF